MAGDDATSDPVDLTESPQPRRRSRAWVGAVVGGVVLALVTIALGYQALRGPDQAVPGGSPTASPARPETPGDPTPSPTGTAPSPTLSSGDNPCPAIADEVREGTLELTPFDGDLPDGALRAWLCGDPHEGFMATGGPGEPLTEGLDRLTEAFNALEPLPADIVCTAEYRMTYVVVLDYADGAQRLRGELHGCRVVTDGERRFYGGEGFLQTLVGLWAEQRAAMEAPSAVPEVCPPLSTLVPTGPDAVLEGYVCSRDFGDIRVLDEIPDDLLARMVESLRTDVGGEVHEMGIEDRGALVLVDGWGSTISLVALQDGSFAVDPGPSAQWVGWEPPVDLADDLLALLGPEPSPTG